MPNYDLPVRNARMQQVLDAINGGKLYLYAGTKPAPGGNAGTVLATFQLKNPAGSVSNAKLTIFDMEDVVATASGTAQWARVVNTSGDWVIDLTVSKAGQGGEIQLSTDIIEKEIDLQVTGLSILEGDG